MLYFDRDKVKSVLDSAWRSLEPGGLMVIHENIKHSNYVRDYRFMFTVNELESYLIPYGEQRYYHAISGQKMAKEFVKDKTVFRTLQKGNV